MRRNLRVTGKGLLATIASTAALILGTAGPMIMTSSTALANPSGFASAFAGQPASPMAWRPTDWDVTVHSRDRETWGQPEAMEAHHGRDCSAAPATHKVSSYENAVYVCREHLMTAINARGYAMIYLTPNQLADFSKENGGKATIRFDLSTLRTSMRDWVDLWITPYENNLQLTLDPWLPDGNGVPKQAVHIRMSEFSPQQGPVHSIFKASVIRDHKVEEVPGNTFTGYETFLVPSAKRRDTFELQISRTHLKFGMPQHNFWWVDTRIKDLGWDSGVLQFGHHSYNPGKDCQPSQLAPHFAQLTASVSPTTLLGGVPVHPLPSNASDAEGHTAAHGVQGIASRCGPNTWHWNNIQVTPARPFTIVRGEQRAFGPASGSSVGAGVADVRFSSPAPAGAHLRFAGIGKNFEMSIDGGATWQPARQQSSVRQQEDLFQSYWTPVPAGTQRVLLRGTNWSGGDWHARDFSIWSLQAPSSEVAGVQASGPVPTTIQVWIARLWQLWQTLLGHLRPATLVGAGLGASLSLAGVAAVARGRRKR